MYVGKSINIKDRVASHLGSEGEKARAMVRESAVIESIAVNSELEALLLEAELIKKYLPRYNSRVKDDKHPLYIKITRREEFPKIYTSRKEDDPNALYFGPFPSSSTVKRVLKQNSLKEKLGREMNLVVKNENFEEAIKIRDQIVNLEYITAPYRSPKEYLENPNLVEDIRRGELDALYAILGSRIKHLRYPKRIECFDVSHLGGKAASSI